MDPKLKKNLRGISLEIRRLLEGRYDERGEWLAGDLEERLKGMGVWRIREPKPVEELLHLPAEDKVARRLVDGYLKIRQEAGVERKDAVAEFVRESAYTWANRLFALRCLEARGIIDEVVLQKDAYGCRSMIHSRFAKKHPEACRGEDDGLFAALFEEFGRRAEELPKAFDPDSPAVALRPSVAALKRCIALLSGRESVRGQDAATDEVFAAPDAFGWAYQYWNADEKDRVFEMVRTKKDAKIKGADIIPATQLYTEPYMVKFLVQNSLGAFWMGMYPDSKLCDQWEYYIKDAGRAPVLRKPVREIRFLDPAQGSGHFHLEAFDLFYAMYEEEAAREHRVLTAREIAGSILNNNLYGIDIDGRSVQIATVALWMKAKERTTDLDASDLTRFHEHLVATNIRLPKERDHLELFLEKHPEDSLLRPALELVFKGMEHADELGALLRIEELVDATLRRLKAEADRNSGVPVQTGLFEPTLVQGAQPIHVEDYDKWKRDALGRLRAHFETEGRAADVVQAFFGSSASRGLTVFNLLSARYDVVAANPPYMGWRTMGPVLQQYLKGHFPISHLDLCCAFLESSVRLLNEGGISSFVLQKTVMFNSTLSDLRAYLLAKTRITCVGHLGTRAFSEMTGAKVDTVMICLQAEAGSKELVRSVFLRVSGDSPQDKAASLRRFGEGETANRYVVLQDLFKSIIGFPFSYRLSKSEQKLFLVGSPAGDAFKVFAGISTAKGERFVRFFWEVPRDGGRWKKCNEGGEAHRWMTDVPLRIDWEPNGTRIRSFPGSALRNLDKVGVEALTFSRMSGKDLGVRKLPPNYVSLDTGRTIHLRPDGGYSFETILVLLNSRYVRRMLRVLNDSFGATSEDLERVRLPKLPSGDVASLEGLAALLTLLSLLGARTRLDSDYFENAFYPDCRVASLRDLSASVISAQIRLESLRVVSGDEANRLIEKNLGYDRTDLDELRADSWGLNSDVLPSCVFDPSVRAEIANLGFPESLFSHSEAPSRGLAIEIASMRERGGVAEALKGAEEPHSDLDSQDRGRAEFPTNEHPEGWIGNNCVAFGYGPLAIAGACSPEALSGADGALLRRPVIDYAVALVLRLLGYRWPKQVEAGEPVPPWADRNGVIPLTEGSGQTSLIERVRNRLSEEFPKRSVAAVEAEFEDIAGVPLKEWLGGSFFERHVSHFGKRPIAWHLQTEGKHPQGRRRGQTGKPVFSCLVYYQKLDEDLLPKIRTQYVGPLRGGYEMQLRTLEQLVNATPDQQGRKLLLEYWAEELEAFDDKLELVSSTGFGPEAMRPALRQYAVDDGLLSLMACWLRRLEDEIRNQKPESKNEGSVLTGWCKVAEATDLHTHVAQWVDAAFKHLDYFCAVVGPEAPKESEFVSDPVSKNLAPLVCAAPARTIKRVLDLACDRWWQRFEEIVLDPLKEELKRKKAEQEQVREQLELDQVKRDYERHMKLADRRDELKREMKRLKEDIEGKTDKGKALRSEIEAWTCPEAATWEDWLETQPLFDGVASLDAKLKPPATIAEFVAQESAYAPDINDGVRVNIAPLQKAGLLHADVLDFKDADKAIVDRAEWRADERRWVREGKLPRPGWWSAEEKDKPQDTEI